MTHKLRFIERNQDEWLLWQTAEVDGKSIIRGGRHGSFVSNGWEPYNTPSKTVESIEVITDVTLDITDDEYTEFIEKDRVSRTVLTRINSLTDATPIERLNKQGAYATV